MAGLGWEEWLWCVFLGFSELLWGQLVLTIPKTSFPKLCRFGTKELPLPMEPDGPKDNKARLLWIRGLTRLQHQVRPHSFVVEEFTASQLPKFLCLKRILNFQFVNFAPSLHNSSVILIQDQFRRCSFCPPLNKFENT